MKEQSVLEKLVWLEHNTKRLDASSFEDYVESIRTDILDLGGVQDLSRELSIVKELLKSYKNKEFVRQYVSLIGLLEPLIDIALLESRCADLLIDLMSDEKSVVKLRVLEVIQYWLDSNKEQPNRERVMKTICELTKGDKSRFVREFAIAYCDVTE